MENESPTKVLSILLAISGMLLIWWERSSSKRLTLILIIVSGTVLAGIVVGLIQAI